MIARRGAARRPSALNGPSSRSRSDHELELATPAQRRARGDACDRDPGGRAADARAERGRRSPLRLALEWDRRSGERFVGLGARHGTELDQSGPDRPARRRPPLHGARLSRRRCSPRAGSRRATARRCRGCCRAAGTACWCRRDANGTRFDFSQRAHVGVDPRRRRPAATCRCSCDPTPAARLRSLCRMTGFPAVLPEWGYGFWKSRDVHEHQDDVFDDFDGFRRHEIALDAIVIDSPWATQYNTWEFNPHQFPDAPGMIRRMRERRRADRAVVHALGQHSTRATGRSRRSPNPSALHPRARAQLRAGGGRRATSSRRADGRAVRRAVVDGDRLARRLHEPGRRASGGANRSSRCSRWASRESRPTTARATTSPTTRRSRTAAAAPRPRGRSATSTGARLQRALDEVHPGQGVVFGRCGWTGQHATGMTWAGDQASDFWSLRVLVVATPRSGGQRLLELVTRRRRLSRPPPGRALPAGAARALAPVRLLHAADAGARADAAGAVALRRQGARRCTAPTCCCTSSSSRTCEPRRRPPHAPACRSSARSA